VATPTRGVYVTKQQKVTHSKGGLPCWKDNTCDLTQHSSYVLIFFYLFAVEPRNKNQKHADQMTDFYNDHDHQNGSENLIKYLTLMNPAPTVPGAGELPL